MQGKVSDQSGRSSDGALPGWVTPDPPIEMAAVFPELVPFARTTTRLHPRPGNPSGHESAMGGPLLWPATEPWPKCTGPHYGTIDAVPVPAVPVLQLYRRDVADLPFPAGADLLQVLWCPREHPAIESGGPKVSLVWRDSATIGDLLDHAPEPFEFFGDLHPRACVVHPEPGVVEYPDQDGPIDLSGGDPRIEAFEADTGLSADATLFLAPGTKVGGYPRFCQEPVWPECACGRTMSYLLTISSGELGAESCRRWMPLAESDLREAWIASSEGDTASDELRQAWEAARGGAGIYVGRGGAMHVFYCAHCPGAPYDQWLDY
jgi:hypothetical protein